MRSRRWGLGLATVLASSALAAACGSSGDTSIFGGGGSPDGSVPVPIADPGADGGFGSSGGPGGGPVPAPRSLVITPATQALTDNLGAPPPTATFSASADGAPASGAVWSLNRGEIGAIDAHTGVFTPSGSVGGTATVSVTYGGVTATATITVTLAMTQNGAGATDIPPAGLSDGGAGGAGGAGGVGGEGVGGKVSPATVAVLNGAPQPLANVPWLYPYDGTVWPRGILPPLLQWNPGGHNFDAVSIQIQEGAFSYKGYFAKPTTATGAFQRHPIPADAWAKLAYSNGGEPVTVSLVFEEGGKAFGPITETWKVAGGTLKGTVYYNSYGTALAHNFGGGLGGFANFGGATLAIRGSSTDPVLVAGNDSECRVCHSVAANGQVLVTQQGNDYDKASAFTLTGTKTETTMAQTQQWYPAISPDGSMLLGGWTGASALFAIPSGAPIPTKGLPAGLQARHGAFSPDGAHVAFNFAGGAGSDGVSIGLIDFLSATKTFSNLRTLHTPSAGTDMWPSFVPTGQALVFEHEVRANVRGYSWGETRSDCDDPNQACSGTGAQGELWWVDVATKKAHRLDALNGKRPDGTSYLPASAAGHGDDTVLQYEPTVNPVPSGGYVWVVFTSRRLYGNVATINPYWSDPRNFDISQSPTTKKLWVAAIDLNGAAGTDPSHPAFYLPAQELLAGNARGFWVVDPCAVSGTSCQTGDECCGGFCQPGASGGLTCTAQKPVCAQEFEKCAADADCCPAAGPARSCINGRCATATPR